uniref:Uncharacterized protein n=2 Tax=Brassica TaxID=3705 RepID=A0A0D3BLV3_BRAOL
MNSIPNDPKTINVYLKTPAPNRPPQPDVDDRRPLKKKKPATMSEDAKALSMIRQITDRYVGHGYDNRDLEACFDDIMKEERRSARIAREEDEMEAKLIAEEEERERQRKLLKLRLRKSLFEVSNGDQRRRLSSSCDKAVEMLFSFFYDSSCGGRDYSNLRNRGTILSLSRLFSYLTLGINNSADDIDSLRALCGKRFGINCARELPTLE